MTGPFAGIAADARQVRHRATRRAPAGFYPINVLFPWVTCAGCSLACSRCGAEGTAPLPRDVAEYNRAVKAWLQKHKDCAEEGR